MTIDVTVDGRPWHVAIESTDRPGRFAITVKGTRREVDASWIDADTLSLLDGTTVHDVRIHRRDNGLVRVEIGGRVHDTVVSSATKGAERVSRSAAATTPHDLSGRAAVAVRAPMAGRVVRVLVAVGDRVSARQGVVVVEAMKMENELRTPRDGTVTEITASPGAAVESGAVLVVIS